MIIGVIAAMSQELTILNKELSKIAKKTDISENLVVWNYLDHQIIITESGIGKVNSAINSYHLLQNYNLDLLINIGSVGAISEEIKISSLFLVQQVFYYDVDLTAFDYKYGQLPKLPQAYNCIYEPWKKFSKNNNIMITNLATGDSFINSVSQAQIIQENVGKKVTIVDMECAAICQVAYLQQWPILVLKAVSDNVYHQLKNINQFNKSLDNISRKLAKITLKLVAEIISKGRIEDNG